MLRQRRTPDRRKNQLVTTGSWRRDMRRKEDGENIEEEERQNKVDKKGYQKKEH